MDTSHSVTMDGKKNIVEALSKEELLIKYKGLLGIAKQAKKAKDEFAEENNKLKEQLSNSQTQREADKRSLLTMQEMLEEFTKNKLEMTSEISELRAHNKSLLDERYSIRNEVETFSIENEALRRQLNRLTEDNESLLSDIDQMEQQLQQVNVLGIEQKKHLDILELEVEKLKEYEVSSRKLQTELHGLMETNKSLEESYNASQTESQTLGAKYQSLKQINSEQRTKFNGLKERFIEVHKKLKQLQECKRILVESHHEYADSVSRWQLEIMHASEQLCDHIQSLTKENAELKTDNQASNSDNSIAMTQLPVLIEYCEKALVEYRRQNEIIDELKVENESLKKNKASVETSTFGTNTGKEKVNQLMNENECLKGKIGTTDKERFDEEAIKRRLSADEEIRYMKSENFKLEDELANTRLENSQMKKEVYNIKAQNDDEVKQIRAECERLIQTLTQADEKLIYLSAENMRLEEESAKVKQSADEQIQHLKAEYLSLKEESESLVNYVVLPRLLILTESCEKAQSEYQELYKLLQIQKKENEILKESRKNNDELEALMKANTSFNHTMSQTDSTAAFKDNIVEEINDLKTNNERLKKELSNAKQNGEAQEVLKLRDDLLTTTQLCEDLQTKLEKQERENVDLLNEMRELNEALKGRGDVISRQQAKHQELVAEIKKNSTALARIESDLNAKEAIIKEKESQVAVMSEDNKSALQEVNRLQNVSRENEVRIKTLSDEITAMRAQFESHETQSEVLSTSTISRTEELARLREVDESFEEKYNKLRNIAVKLKKKAHEQSLSIADLEKQLADSKTKHVESNERIIILESERESLQKELKTCKNQIENLKIEVEKLKSSKKQSNVLTLEIEAYEKSLNETSAKLSSKTTECDLARETLHSKESAIEVMKKEIKILEESKDSEKTHSFELKTQIDKLQTQLKDIIHAKQELNVKLEESQNERQTLQSELDEMNQRLESISRERDAERATLLNEKENLHQTINSLNDQLIASSNRITVAERSFQDLHQEYASYKLKAQSVLRQNQTKESSKERELEEELTLLKADHKDLSNRLHSMVGKLQATEKAIEELQEENRCVQNRNSEMTNIISELRQQTDSLALENKKLLETYQETLKSHRVQIEALDSCHLAQLQELQTKYDREIIDLKKIHKKDSETMQQKPLEKLDYILMEREDAEGSEAETAHTPKYMTSRKRSTHDTVPLDELLNSPAVQNSYTVLERTQSISPSVELQETKERLQQQDSSVRHLTSLLAESEQDLAKLTQLNEMLKEEVRRQERTVEREKHMQNSEYLKNIVLKFVSLNNGDERTRLVPVLNTILKLSPTETEMLQNVAKGKALDNNNRSWGSFLPHWGSS